MLIDVLKVTHSSHSSHSIDIDILFTLIAHLAASRDVSTTRGDLSRGAPRWWLWGIRGDLWWLSTGKPMVNGNLWLMLTYWKSMVTYGWWLGGNAFFLDLHDEINESRGNLIANGWWSWRWMNDGWLQGGWWWMDGYQWCLIMAGAYWCLIDG